MTDTRVQPDEPPTDARPDGVIDLDALARDPADRGATGEGAAADGRVSSASATGTQVVDAALRLTSTRSSRFGADAVRAALFRVLLVVIGAATTALFLGGPIGRLWVSERQHHLAADFAVHRKGVRAGQALAVLQIPIVRLNTVVAEGSNQDDLHAGPIHRAGTPRPGDPGNAVLYGRAQRWGGPFGKLAKLKVGDLVLTQNKGDSPILFKVTEIHRTSAGDGTLLSPSDDHRLTLVTSSGGILSRSQLVVVAVSGDTGKLLTAAPQGHGPERDSPATGTTPALALLTVLLVCAVVLWSRAYGATARLTVFLPLVALAAVLVFLEADLLLPVLH